MSACRTLSRSPGRGSNASGSPPGGTTVSTSTRFSPTAAASAARSAVVATTRVAAEAGAAAAIAAASAKQPRTPARILTRSHPGALGNEAMHHLLLADRRGEAAVHHHAGEPISVQLREPLLLLQQVDHRPGGVVHRLVEVGVFADRDQIEHVLAIRQRFDPALPPRALGAEAMQALVDVDHLADAAVPGAHHQLFRLLLADLALLHQKIRRLAPEDVERLVEIAVDADRDPRVPGLDARPLELHVLEHLDRDAHLLVGGLERGQIDLAVALRGMGIPGPQQRALDEHGHVERGTFGQIADVHVAAVASGRHRAVLTGLGARDADRAGEGSERDLDAGGELRDLAVEVEIEILHLAVRELARELAEHT